MKIRKYEAFNCELELSFYTYRVTCNYNPDKEDLIDSFKAYIEHYQVYETDSEGSQLDFYADNRDDASLGRVFSVKLDSELKAIIDDDRYLDGEKELRDKLLDVLLKREGYTGK